MMHAFARAVRDRYTFVPLEIEIGIANLGHNLQMSEQMRKSYLGEPKAAMEQSRVKNQFDLRFDVHYSDTADSVWRAGMMYRDQQGVDWFLERIVPKKTKEGGPKLLDEVIVHLRDPATAKRRRVHADDLPSYGRRWIVSFPCEEVAEAAEVEEKEEYDEDDAEFVPKRARMA
jgi:hypothetical protein